LQKQAVNFVVNKGENGCKGGQCKVTWEDVYLPESTGGLGVPDSYSKTQKHKSPRKIHLQILLCLSYLLDQLAMATLRLEIGMKHMTPVIISLILPLSGKII